MGTNGVGINDRQICLLQEKIIKVEKIISYTAESEFNYYYPRLVIPEELNDREVELFGVEQTFEFVIASINHLIEILCFSYAEFMAMIEELNKTDLFVKLSLNELLFDIFKEEYPYYLRPLMNLSTNYIQVEAPYDKYYFISKVSGYAYRLDRRRKIQTYVISSSDLTEITFLRESSSNCRKIQEHILTILSPKIYSWFK